MGLYGSKEESRDPNSGILPVYKARIGRGVSSPELWMTGYGIEDVREAMERVGYSQESARILAPLVHSVSMEYILSVQEGKIDPKQSATFALKPDSENGLSAGTVVNVRKSNVACNRGKCR